MKSIKKLEQQLQKIEQIEKQMKELNSIDKISIMQFIRFRRYAQKKVKLHEELEQVKRYAKGINLVYEYETSCCINNMSINCRKYKRIESKAKYKRDLKLFKCGFTEKRPVNPKFQFIQEKFPNLCISNNVFIKKICIKINKFKSKILPQKIKKIPLISANVTGTYNEDVIKYKQSLRVEPKITIKLHNGTNINSKFSTKTRIIYPAEYR